MTGQLIVVWAGVACLAIGVAWLSWAQLRERIDLVDTITEWDADRGMRASSIKKLGEAVALFVSSWVVVYDALDGTINEWAFAVYVTAWAARYALGQVLKARAGMFDAAASAVRDGK